MDTLVKNTRHHPLVKQLAEGRINFHQLVKRRIVELGQSPNTLMARAPVGLKIQTINAFERGDAKWCGWNDIITPKRLAIVLRFDPEEFIQAYQRGYNLAHGQGAVSYLEAIPPRPKAHSLPRLHVTTQFQAGPARSTSRQSMPRPVRPVRNKAQEAAQLQRLALDIKRLRQELNWTIADCCRHLDVGINAFNNAQAGKNVSLATAERIGQDLQKALDDGQAKPARLLRPTRQTQSVFDEERDRQQRSENAQQIKGLRHQLNWSQSEAAAFVGCSAPHFSQVENGKAGRPSLVRLIRDQLQQALDEGLAKPIEPERGSQAEQQLRQELAPQIQQLRQDLNWVSATALCQHLNIDLSTLKRAEKGQRVPVETALRIRDRLQQAIDDGLAQPSRPERGSQAEQQARQDLAPQIRQLRQQLGWTMADVARHLKISPTTLSYAEAGFKVSLNHMENIKQKLQQALDEGQAKSSRSPEEVRELAQQITELRQQLGWSAAGLCRHLKISLNTLERAGAGQGASLDKARLILDGMQQIQAQGILEPIVSGQSQRQTLAKPKDLSDRAALHAWLNHPKHRHQLSGLNTRQVITVGDAIVTIIIEPLTPLAEAAD